MTLKRLILIIMALTAITLQAWSREDTRTRIFNPRFRTLKTMAEDNFMSPPIIRMGTQDRLIVSFDEIGEDNSWLECRLVHCNRDWQPSRLVDSEYVDGFNYMRIEDFASSYATFVHFVNYRITIPNEDLQIKHSGNYLLQVYDPDYPDDIILQTRFQVLENGTTVTGGVTSRTDRGHYSDWQQLAFTVDTRGLGPINQFQDITVTVSQNMREETARTIRGPLRTDGSAMIYDHLDQLIFPAGNEYRRFESVSNSFPGMHVDSLRFGGTNYHVWLKPDSPRANREYSYDRTQHGRFLVHEYNASDSDLGADYITVHFRLDTDEYLGSDVYVDGEFTHGLYTDYNRMTYDRDLQAYTAEIPVKQGAYNYQYVVKQRQGSTVADPAPVEGNKYETDNEYGVEVWYNAPGARADRLVGFALLENQ